MHRLKTELMIWNSPILSEIFENEFFRLFWRIFSVDLLQSILKQPGHFIFVKFHSKHLDIVLSFGEGGSIIAPTICRWPSPLRLSGSNVALR